MLAPLFVERQFLDNKQVHMFCMEVDASMWLAQADACASREVSEFQVVPKLSIHWYPLGEVFHFAGFYPQFVTL